MKTSLSKSSFSHSIFNTNISPCFTKLIVEQNSCYSISTTNDYVDSWYAQINHAILSSCAQKTKRRQQLPYYYSSHTVHLLNKHHSISKRTANTNHLASIQQDLNNSIELDKTCLLESLRPNSTRDCFKYLRSFTRRKLPNQMHWMNRKASTSIEIAILLNDYFCSVFLEKHEIQILQPEKPTIFLSDLHVNLKKVEKALKFAKTSCITNDRLPTFILNYCSELISPLVVQLFVKVLETKTWPELWKCAFITPVLKSSNPENVENYRPINILPQLSIVLERMIFDFIYPKIRAKVTPAQHGFMTKRSTVTQLLEYLDQIYNDVEAKSECLSVYFDFRKAFDQVPHHILILKLGNLGFDVSFLELFASYLTNRTQNVLINNEASPKGHVTSGVPQGSVLGPLLFILFINDMPAVLKTSKCFLFADDSKLYSKYDFSLVQIDIDLFINWTLENEMTFNSDKCKVICFNSTSPKSTLCLNDYPIPSVSSIKDLGVTISSDLKWDIHIKTKLVAVNKAFHFLKRSIPYGVSMRTKFKYYQLCIVSILLYGSQVWFPSLTYRRKLELFNRKCLKWVTGVNDYTEQLRKTNSLPISFTIALHDMCFLNRVLTDQFDFNLYRYINFTFAAKDLRNSSRPKLSTTQNCRLFFTEQFFFYRVCRYANMISANNIADIFSSPEIFKAKLKIYLKNRIDMFNLNNSCSMLLCCHCINCRS